MIVSRRCCRVTLGGSRLVGPIWWRRLLVMRSRALRRALVIAEEPLGLYAVQPWPLVVRFVMGIPRMAVFNRELAMPLSVWRGIGFVNVNMTALTQRDHVYNAIVGIVTVDVMKRVHQPAIVTRDPLAR